MKKKIHFHLLSLIVSLRKWHRQLNKIKYRMKVSSSTHHSTHSTHSLCLAFFRTKCLTEHLGKWVNDLSKKRPYLNIMFEMKKCLNVRQKLGTKNVLSHSHILTLNLSPSHTLTHSHSLIQSLSTC